MATKRGPKPYDQHQVSTLFLRVPAEEFRQVISGRKTEFRASPGLATQLARAHLPTPVVAYAMRNGDARPEARLVVLEECWMEPLGAISKESLERENQPDMAHFRRYWARRSRKHFKPTREVIVYRTRAWDPEKDPKEFADALLQRLYGAFL